MVIMKICRKEGTEMSVSYLPYLLDILVVTVVLCCAAAAFRKGFVIAALGFLPMAAALIGARFLSPYVSRFLRGTPVFGSLAESISSSMKLDEIIGEGAARTQTEIIEGMQLPGFLRDALLENNNPVIYRLFDVEGLQEYIAGFLANICINVVSVILAFLLIFIGVRLVLNALNLISRLPVLNFFNRFCGLLVGGAKGLSVVWVACTILTFFQCSAKFSGLFAALDASHAAKLAYENNILLYLILTIFT